MVLLRQMAGAVLLAAAVSGAAVAAPRAPTGKWTLNFADTQCLASRPYGSETVQLALAIKPSPLGDLYEVIILHQAGGSRFAREEAATVRIGDGAPIAVKLLSYKLKDGGASLSRFRLPEGAAASLSGAASLTVTAKRDFDYAFALSGTAPLMTEMARCLASLQDHWNIAPAKRSALRTRAAGDLRRAFSSNDYPETALDKNQEGTVAAALLIDETGKVVDCTLTATSGAALLDAQTCVRIMVRAKFKPAVGADGRPARDSSSGRISWRIPG